MEFAFYFASGIAVVSTLRVITNTNPVHALLYLIISLIAVATTFFSLGAPFAGVLEVIAYAGAIMVLFVFVVMMLNLGPASVQQERAWLKPGIWIGPVILGTLLLAELLYVLFANRPALPSVTPRSTPRRSASACSGLICWWWNSPRCCCSLQPSRHSIWAATRPRSQANECYPS
ncbi:hypothetical protein PSA5_08615 [Pseudomonas syringae pv. actinidiae]|nr:hypothetical protein PSA5_08615 [Pseudomonas syringae pv. actinidiae]